VKSPFPGMDPYIEDRGLWADFHTKLIGEIERRLAALVPERYFVQIGRRGALPEPEANDTAVSLRAFIDEHFRETFIDIFEAGPGGRLVTSIEVLSPSNKRHGTEGWEQYLRKRNALLLGSANLVEIDLLRGGRRMPMVEPWPDSPYYVLVGRQSRVPYCQVWPVHFHQPLPEVPVPLASPDPDVRIALQPLVEAVYERSRYARAIDYGKPLDPPLAPEQAAWLQGRLRGEAKPGKPPATRRRRGKQ
jgi:hypothetical protein